MKIYRIILIAVSSFLLLTATAQAVENTDTADLEVTIDVVDSPEDAPQQITNRIRLPETDYLQARERHQYEKQYHLDGENSGPQDGTGNMERNQEMQQNMYQNQNFQMTPERTTDIMNGGSSGNGGPQGGPQGGGQGR